MDKSCGTHERCAMHTEFQWEKAERKRIFSRPGSRWKVNIKWILKKYAVDYINFVRDRDQELALKTKLFHHLTLISFRNWKKHEQ
jgi:hypothetical protein